MSEPDAHRVPAVDATQASKEAGVYTYSRLAGSILILLSLALGARLYGKSEFGFVSALMLLYESAIALGSLGLPDAVFYLIGGNPDGAGRVVRQTSFLLLLLSVPTASVVWLVGRGISPEIALAPSLPWIAFTILIELPTQPMINQLLATGRAHLASTLYVCFSMVRPIAILAPALTGIELGWIPVILAAMGLSRLVVHHLIIRSLFPIADKRRWLEQRALRSIFWFALPAGLAMLGNQLNPQIDKYVVQLVRGNEDFVLYTAAAWELPLITMVPYAIGAVMQARYVRLHIDGNHDELRRLWHQTVRKTALIVVPLSMMIIALAREIVTTIIGDRYADATPVFQIFTAIMLHRVASYSSLLQSIGENRTLLVTSLLTLIVNLLLSYPFTLRFGFLGAAIATVCAMIPSFAFMLWRMSVGLRTTLGGVMPWRFYGGTTALACVVALGVWLLIQTLALSPGLRLAIGAVTYLVAFVVLGRKLRLIASSDLAYVRRWLSFDMLRK